MDVHEKDGCKGRAARSCECGAQSGSGLAGMPGGRPGGGEARGPDDGQ